MKEEAILVNLPTSVRGFVYKDENGDPVIVVNARLTREQNVITYDHEQDHIRRDELNETNYNEYGGEENEETDHHYPDPGPDPAGSCSG